MKEYAKLMNATWTIRKRWCEMEIHHCVAVWTMRPYPELRFNNIFHVFITYLSCIYHGLPNFWPVC